MVFEDYYNCALSKFAGVCLWLSPWQVWGAVSFGFAVVDLMGPKFVAQSNGSNECSEAFQWGELVGETCDTLVA